MAHGKWRNERLRKQELNFPNSILINFEESLMPKSFLFQTYAALLEQLGHSASKEDFRSLEGLPLYPLLDKIRELHGFKKANLHEIYSSIQRVQLKDLKPKENVNTVLLKLYDAGCSLTIVSFVMHKVILLQSLNVLGISDSLFDEVICPNEENDFGNFNLFQDALNMLAIQPDEAAAISYSPASIHLADEINLKSFKTLEEYSKLYLEYLGR